MATNVTETLGFVQSGSGHVSTITHRATFHMLAPTTAGKVAVSIDCDVSDDYSEILLGTDDLAIVNLIQNNAELQHHAGITFTMSPNQKCTSRWIMYSPLIVSAPSVTINQNRRKILKQRTVEELITTAHVHSGHSCSKIVSSVLSSWGHIIPRSTIDEQIKSCKDCLLKPKAVPTASSQHKPKSEIAFQDLSNLPTQCVGGEKYLSTIKYFPEDDQPRTFFRCIANKNDAIQHTAWFLAKHPDVCIIRTDNGSEFTNADCKSLFKKYGISHETTAPGHSFSNGCAERAHREFKKLAELQLGILKLPNRLDIIPWLSGAIESAVNARNSDTPPQFVFGTPVTFKTPADTARFDGPATLSINGFRRGVFLSQEHNGACDVITSHSKGLVRYVTHPSTVFPLPENQRDELIEAIALEHQEPSLPKTSRKARRVLRRRQLVQLAQPIRRTIPIKTHKRAGEIYPGFGFIADDEAKPSEINAGEFNGADEKEWTSIMTNEVLEPVMPVPPQSTIINTRFRRTWKSVSGGGRKAKTRFIARAISDNREVETTTALPSAPTRRIATIKGLQMGYHSATIDVTTAFLLVPMTTDVYIRLPSTLPTFALQHGFKPHGTYKLKKTLYGLKEAPRLFNLYLSDKLKSIGWQEDLPGFFYKGSIDTPSAILSAYVDDIHAWSPDPIATLLEVQEILPCSDLMPVNNVPQRHVGEEIYQNDDTFYRDISTYVSELDEHRPALERAANSTRGIVPKNVEKAQRELYTPGPQHDQNVHLMQQICGQLGWISMCNPAVSCRYSMLASHVQHPSEFVLRCALGTIRELLHSPPPPLEYQSPSAECVIRLWVDAAMHDHHSRRGWVLQIGKTDRGDHTNIIDWSTKSIKAKSFRSSTEAEVYAIETALQEADTTIKQLMKLFPTAPVEVLSDSMSGILRLIRPEDPRICEGQKRQILQYLQSNKDAVLMHVPGLTQKADPLTKIKPMHAIWFSRPRINSLD